MANKSDSKSEIVVMRGMVYDISAEWTEWRVFVNGQGIDHFGEDRAAAIRYARKMERDGKGKIAFIAAA